MPSIDMNNDQPRDAIYPTALRLMNATLSEIFTGRWSAKSRLAARRARLAARHQQWLSGAHDLGVSSGSALALAVIGPCRTRGWVTTVCCDTMQLQTEACWSAAACGCKVIAHVEHIGKRYSPALQLEAELRTAAVLSSAGAQAPTGAPV